MGRALAPSPAGCAWAGGMPVAAEPAPTPHGPPALLGTGPGATQAGVSWELLAAGAPPPRPRPPCPLCHKGTVLPGPAGRSRGPSPPAWSLAHRRAALPKEHATATCWGHQHGPRDPGLVGGDPSCPERVTPASSSVVCSVWRTQHAHKTGNSPQRWRPRPRPRPHTRASRPWSTPPSPRPGRPAPSCPRGKARALPDTRHKLPHGPGGHRDQSHSHLGVTWSDAGAAPP